MAIVDLSKYGVGVEIRKILRRDWTIYPLYPYKGGGYLPDLLDGIYQMPRYPYGRVCRRIDFYDYVITHTDAQQARREKFAAAVAAWQSLTPEQKKAYNKKAVGKHMSGYNLYLSEYMYG